MAESKEKDYKDRPEGMAIRTNGKKEKVKWVIFPLCSFTHHELCISSPKTGSRTCSLEKDAERLLNRLKRQEQKNAFGKKFKQENGLFSSVL